MIWLDFPVHVRLGRVFLRSLRHFGRTRPDLPDGSPEQFDWEFFRWIWNTRKSGRIRIERFVAAVPHEKTVVKLQRDGEIRAFLSAVERQP